ncbi:MAG: hypothetical protein Q9160_007030 [Pyrenula sp. 1 TL-2023]
MAGMRKTEPITKSQPSITRDSPSKNKLIGRRFYESIGSPKLILAPMVDRSEFAWRLLTRSFLPNDPSRPLLAYSPMFHARLFAAEPKNRHQHFQPTREGFIKQKVAQAEKPYLDGNPANDRPLFVQFCANDPDELLAAARLVEPYCDAVDLNLGCPQGIAKKGRYGAFLQEDWDLIYKLVNKLNNELSIPVTAKLRILETKEKTLAYAQKILSAGASIITVHGRRREQKGHNTGLADWSYIRYLRENLPPETVIFCNGNVLNQTDIQACLDATGVDGVMSAEGNLSDPTIFAEPPAVGDETPEYWRGKDGQGGYRVDAVLRRYMDIIYKHILETELPIRLPLFVPSKLHEDLIYSEEKAFDDADADPEPPRKKRKRDDPGRVSPSLRPMQGHLFGLLRQVVSVHTDIRDALAKCVVGDINAFENILKMVEKVVAKGIADYEQNAEYSDVSSGSPAGDAKKDDDFEISSFVTATSTKYKRPWWICQPHIRPLPSQALENGALSLGKKEFAKSGQREDEIRSAVPESSIAAEKTVESVPNDVAAEVPREALVCG